MIPYWVGLAVAVMPFVLGQSLYNNYDIVGESNRFAMLFYAAAIVWAFMFTPAVGVGAAFVLSVLDAIVTNLFVAVTTDMLLTQQGEYRLTLQSISGSSFGVSLATIVVFAIYALMSGPPSAAEEASTSFEGYYDTLGPDHVLVRYIQGITLFLTVSTVLTTGLAGLLRQYVNRSCLHSRYSNAQMAGFILLPTAAAVCLKHVPFSLNLALHRSLVWITLYLAVLFRRRRVRVLYQPINRRRRQPAGLCGSISTPVDHPLYTNAITLPFSTAPPEMDVSLPWLTTASATPRPS